MKALVIGYGSIGQRHARLLAELGCRVAVMSHRSIEFSACYSDLPAALTSWQPDYVVVANRTCDHRETIAVLAQYGYQGKVLVEKPLFDQPFHLSPKIFSHVAVGYNLRCHPILAKLKSFLHDSARIITASIYVGSFLPDWRPNTDYRQNYSAKRNEGGGVLRDLSHELDYILWLLGPWRKLAATGGHFSNLKIDTDDVFALLMVTEFCPLVCIHLNYLDRIPRREIIVNTDYHTVRADLINSTLEINGVQQMFNIERDDTYRAQHQAMLTGKIKGLCTWSEAMETLYTIQSAEQAALSHIWIER